MRAALRGAPYKCTRLCARACVRAFTHRAGLHRKQASAGPRLRCVRSRRWRILSPHSHTCTWKDLWRTQVRPKPTATHSDTAQAILRSACRPGSVYNVNLPQRAAVDAHASVSTAAPPGVSTARVIGNYGQARHLRHVPRGVAVGRWSCVRWRPPRLSVISPSQCAPTRGARRCAKPHSVGRRCTAPTECFALRRSAVVGQSAGMARAAFSSAWATLVVLLSYSCPFHSDSTYQRHFRRAGCVWTYVRRS